MKATTKKKLTFADLPQDYAGLCRVLVPRVIRDRADHANVTEVTDAMAVHASAFTNDQEDYFDLLCALLEKWDAENVKWPRRTPLERLAYLTSENKMNGAELARVLGVSRNLGPMILRGEREITAAHARVLGAHFGLPAGAFIE